MLENNNPTAANPQHRINWIIVASIAALTVIVLIDFTIIGFYGTQRYPDAYAPTEAQLNITLLNSTTYEEQTPEAIGHRVDHLLNQLPGFSDINCSAIFSADKNETEKAKRMKSPDFALVWKQIEDSNDQCKALKQTFVFLDHPLSPEEAEYPIAYGALVYKDVEQVAFMLSSLYRPNNVFVFMVDRKASDDFKKRIFLFSKCFTNVHVQLTENPVVWAGYEITKAVFEAVRILTTSKLEWKYFQYLTGFDLPLKTNLEMIRIFKEMNETANVDLMKFQTSRLSWGRSTVDTWFRKIVKRIKREPVLAQKTEADSPLPLFKSSLSATFSRESAESMIRSTKVQQLLTFLEDTECSDESIWGTILGNPGVLPIPGSFNGSAILEILEHENHGFNSFGEPNLTRPNSDTFVPSTYYISRYQIWEVNETKHLCQGKFVKESCVFGVCDLPILITRPELVVHKLYFNFEAAAYYCLYQNQWKRTLNLEAQQKFNATPYSNLAMVQASRGIPVNNISFYYM